MYGVHIKVFVETSDYRFEMIGIEDNGFSTYEEKVLNDYLRFMSAIYSAHSVLIKVHIK